VLTYTLGDLSGLDAKKKHAFVGLSKEQQIFPYYLPAPCTKCLAKSAFRHLVYPLSRRIWIASAILLQGSMSAEVINICCSLADAEL